MNKEIYTDSKITPNFSEIFNDLLKSEQNSSLPMLNLPPPLCTDTFTCQNPSNIIIGSGYESDVGLDGYDKEILGILEDAQCSLNAVKSQSQISAPAVCTEQCSLFGSYGIWYCVRYGI